jgi:lipoprotein-releasing system ATP-binding protein
MILSAKNLSKSFFHPKKFELFSELSLEIHSGEAVAILGRSGEGKTTLLHLLGTLEKPDSGAIEIRGSLVTPSNIHSLRSRHLGFIFQAFNLLEDFTALENVLMPARILRKAFDRKRGLELLDLVGLTDRADFPAKLLSGGERQRVAIARALCNDPDLILADEPSGNLDSENAAEVGKLLFSLVRQKQKSLLLVTHETAFAAACDKRYTLAHGKLLQTI